jgi:hypothetical protein
MPVCKKCDITFSRRPIIDGRMRNLQRRQYCLDCSPFGNHNTKNFDKDIQKGKTFCCEDCNEEYVYLHKGDTILKCAKCTTAKRSAQRKQKCVEYKGGKCLICSYDKYIGALEFHHIDPEKKSFDISQFKASITQWDVLKEELDKCALVCANCHREVEAGITKIPREERR